MFSFRLDKKKLDKMIPLCGNFIDIVYLNSKVIVASEDGICYSQLIFNATSDDPKTTREGFRIETAILKRLAVDGVVEVHVLDTNVTISFYGESQEPIFKSSTTLMNSFLTFNEVLSIIDKFSEFRYSEIKTESGIIKLASKYNDVVVSEGEFFYVYHNNSYIFCKSELPPFCVDGKAFKNITSVIPRFKLIEDYIVFLEDNLLVKLRRNKMPLSSDLNFVIGGKALAKFDVDFKRANYLVNSLGAEDYKSSINFTLGKFFIESVKGNFEAKIDVENDYTREKSVEDKLKALQNISKSPSSSSLINKTVDRVIKVPKWVYPVISDYNKLTFFIKRNSTLVKFGKNIVVFQGGFVG